MGSFKYPMKFCSTCSAPVTVKVPLGDNRPRAVCDACGAIHYDNPKVVVGCLVVAGSSVLLCRRGIDPRSGFWTLPAGYLEKGETTEQGAVRETWEEARARVDIDSLYHDLRSPLHIANLHVLPSKITRRPLFGRRGNRRGTGLRRKRYPLGRTRIPGGRPNSGALFS